MRVEGKPEGSFCGSQHVNEEFLRWLKKEARQTTPSGTIVPYQGNKDNADLEDWCAQVGLPIDEALRQADEQFEKYKQEFLEVDMKPDVVYIYSSGRRDCLPVHVTSDLMVACWNKVLMDIKKHIESQFSSETTLIIMAGAISRSEYFMTIMKNFKDTLNTRYKTNCRITDGAREAGHSMSHMVCLGAHYKYSDIAPSGAPATDKFAVAIDEELDPPRHGDAMYNAGDLKARGAWAAGRAHRGPPAPNGCKVFRGEAGGKIFVRDRLASIMDHTIPRIAGQSYTMVKWDWGWIDEDDTSDLDFQVYWVKPGMTHIRDGSPIFELLASEADDGSTTYTNVLHGGIYLWGPPVPVRLPPFAALGFEVTVIPESKREKERGGLRHKNQTEEKEDGADHRGWVYLTRTEITVNGPNLSFKVQMAKPGKGPFQKRLSENEMDCRDDGEEVLEDEGEMWDQVRDPNAPMDPEDLYDLKEVCVVNKNFNPTPRE